MSKTELIEFAAEKAGTSKAEAGRVLDALMEGITEALKDGKKVSLIGFGTFQAKTRAARDGINPLTKEELHIPEKRVASFKAGSKLKDALN